VSRQAARERPITVEIRDDVLLRLWAARALHRGELLELHDVTGVTTPGGAAEIVTVPFRRIVLVIGEIER
jgi:hypothetical protein